MLKLSEAEFFGRHLDGSIPKIAQAADLYRSGDFAGARHVFREYVKNTLRYDLFSAMPTTYPEGTGGVDTETYLEEILDGTVVSVGFKYRFPDGKVDWKANPTFNGYVEWTYHLQYHNEICYLARAYKEKKDERYARRFAELITSWMEQTTSPDVQTEIDGGSRRTLETGARLSNAWQHAVGAFIDSPSVSDGVIVDIFRSVAEQCRELMRSESLYNWLITEMRGLVSAGIVFPFFRDAPLWRETAIRRLCEQLKIQIDGDGLNVEAAAGYQRGVMKSYLFVLGLAETFGYSLPDEIRAGIRRIAGSYILLCRPDLKSHSANDSRPVSVRDTSKDALALFPDDETLRFFATERAEGKAPDFTNVTLGHSGFGVFRTGWDADAVYGLFSGGAPNFWTGWHKHEDALQFTLFAYGAPMISDPGFYAYDGSAMRMYIISSRSHATGLVDGKGQNARAQKACISTVIDPDAPGLLQTSEGDGYIEYRSRYGLGYGDATSSGSFGAAGVDLSADEAVETIPAAHARRVLFFEHGLGTEKRPFFLLLDSFGASDEKTHEYEISFPFPAVTLSESEGGITVGYPGGQRLLLVSAGGRPKVTVGQKEPVFAGWLPVHGPTEHEHTPAPLVSFLRKGKDAAFATLLFPVPDRGVLPEAAVVSDGKTVSLTLGGKTFRAEF